MDIGTDQKPRSTAFHLQLQQEMDESVLESMLKKAGIPARVVRTVTPLHEGIAFTHLLAESEWNESTGATACSGQCRTQDGQPSHIPYRDLSQDQRDEFHGDLARGFDYYRSSLYSLSDGKFRQMDQVAIIPCED